MVKGFTQLHLDFSAVEKMLTSLNMMFYGVWTEAVNSQLRGQNVWLQIRIFTTVSMTKL